MVGPGSRWPDQETRPAQLLTIATRKDSDIDDDYPPRFVHGITPLMWIQLGRERSRPFDSGSDGWFDAVGENASGVASIVALAEYYAKAPRSERRRTIVFVGLDGHHNSGPGACVGRRWMCDSRETLFPKTALMINRLRRGERRGP